MLEGANLQLRTRPRELRRFCFPEGGGWVLEVHNQQINIVIGECGQDKGQNGQETRIISMGSLQCRRCLARMFRFYPSSGLHVLSQRGWIRPWRHRRLFYRRLWRIKCRPSLGSGQVQRSTVTWMRVTFAMSQFRLGNASKNSSFRRQSVVLLVPGTSWSLGRSPQT